MPRSTFILGEKSVAINYDPHGVCMSTSVFGAVSEAVSDLKPIDAGLTGGSHGTDHGFEDYAADAGWTVRVVRPGALSRGWIEVRPS